MNKEDFIYKEGLLEGKKAIVTGGATGIGKNITEHLLYLGVDVAICGRRKEVIRKASQDMNERSFKGKVIFQSCDIRNEQEVESFVDLALKEFGRVDYLVNCAGGQFPLPAANLSNKGFRTVTRMNLEGTWHVTREVAKRCFIPQKFGRVVTIIAQIKRGMPLMVHTGAARAGIENMTKTLSVEWAPYNILLNCIAPGVIENSGTARYHPSFLKNAEKHTLVQRNGRDDEVGALATFLLIDKIASFITGQTFYVDGGASIYGILCNPFLIAKMPPPVSPRSKL
mmetsp:Transcript_5896/g.8630  ORF Transcript_5896/g.8630 Transcript_5896/m.8630 type:complete len:283 (+) Transcript_5896:489-1337(+)